MTTKLHYVTREVGDHTYEVHERLGGRKAGVYGVVKRRYEGDGRYGATYGWHATAYATGARKQYGTRGRAADWLGDQEPVPATAEISGDLPDVDVWTLRAIAASGDCAWIQHAGQWHIIGPADEVRANESVTVRTMSGDFSSETLDADVSSCVVDGHELAWALPARERRRYRKSYAA